MDAELLRLVRAAEEAQENAYVPYSGYHVGASVLTEDGSIYSACNVECKPSSNILHAEQRAISKAVEDGHRDFVAVGLKTDGDGAQPPCGNCRNMLASIEYDMDILVVTGSDEWDTYSLPELLPDAYTGRDHENV